MSALVLEEAEIGEVLYACLKLMLIKQQRRLKIRVRQFASAKRHLSLPMILLNTGPFEPILG